MGPEESSSDISSQPGIGSINVRLRHWFFNAEFEVIPKEGPNVIWWFLGFAQVMVGCLVQLVKVEEFGERHRAKHDVGSLPARKVGVSPEAVLD